MPNTCLNYLNIDSSDYPHKFDDLLEALRGDDDKISFNTAVTIPEALEDDCWQWCWDNWGTKWDPMDDTGELEVDEKSGSIFSYMSTAWTPPTEWLTKVAKMFPEYDFNLLYLETGLMLSGSLSISEGMVDHEEDDTLKKHLERLRDFGWEEEDLASHLLDFGFEVLNECLQDEHCLPSLVMELQAQLEELTDDGILDEEEIKSLLAKAVAHPNFQEADK